jgi:DNA-binding PadR family transcriptional regulator
MERFGPSHSQMARTLAKKWLRPQAVPRGFLRLYILAQLSRGPETGYSIMQKIDEKTDGAWKPGPGTMYPLLRSMVSDGLARSAGKASGGAKAYAITPGGRRELERIRKGFTNMGRRERILGRLFSDVLPPSVMVPAMVSRYKDGIELFRKMISQIPRPERDAYLRDVKLFMESQVQWIELQMDAQDLPGQRPAGRARR